MYVSANELADIIWDLYDTWPKKVQQTAGLQIIRSADSISTNLAEGHGRFHFRERTRFYYIARGSFEETKDLARKLIRRKVLNPQEIAAITTLVNEIGPLLNAFIRRTRQEEKSK